jgi:hypothetical protein
MCIFTPPYIGKSGPYGPTMSLCTTMMSKGVHYITFSVMPDVEHHRTSQDHSHDPDMCYAHYCALCSYLIW